MTDFNQLYDAERFRSQAHLLADTLADYLKNCTSGTEKAIQFETPDAMLANWQQDFDNPAPKAVNTLFEKILAQSIHIHSPRYMGHQVAVPAPVTVLAAALESLLNNSGAIHEMGMTISSLEKIITQWFAKKLGFPEESYGIITSGGTLASLTAMLTARAIKAPDAVWTTGNQTPLAIMVSEQAHYCIDRAARIMGLGTKGIIKVPVNDRFQMRTELLEDLLAAARSEGYHVFAIVGSACTTATGSYDNLSEIARFAQKNNIWMHTDGAHGGVAALSEKYKHLVQGIEHSDSVVVDFHKMLMVPSLSTGVFYRNPKDSFHTFAQQASYLFANNDEDWYNTGKRTFECTRPGTILRVYTLLYAYGATVFQDIVDTLYNLGKTFAVMIQRNPAFELALEPETNIVCFRYIGDKQEASALNALNQQIRQCILEDGRFYVVSTIIAEVFYLRVALMNPLTTEKELGELLDFVAAKAPLMRI